ncbi:MAG TPA: hypothetical protein DEB24_00870 [Coriobacteriia bacterium]|nr:hypothetical protein [Coriobacteriia bacterium]
MAIAGLILGILILLLFIALIVFAVTVVPDMINNPQNYGLPADFWQDAAESLGYDRDFFKDMF